jgi:hypothetical protein
VTTAPQSATSPIALTALLLGVIGRSFSFLGCAFFPILLVSSVLCLIAIVLGFMENQKVARGESSSSNRALALTGAGTGMAGCAVSLFYSLVMVGFVVIYFGFIVFYFVMMIFLVGISAAAGGP